MEQVTRPRLIRQLPTIVGGLAGAIVAAVAALLPDSLLEQGVGASGLAAVLPVAAPPLGLTARAALALGGGVGGAAVVWAALFLLIGPGGLLARKLSDGDAPAVRRADAHPDAPPRWPLTAEELPELALPRDLDMPLAAFDPDALPPVPLEPVRAVRSLAPALAPGERLETFTLTPPASGMRAGDAPSIETLLRRLEQSARRRVATAQ